MALPCGTTAWVLTGPVVAPSSVTIGGYPYYVVSPTAVLTGSLTSQQAFSYASCSTGFSIKYIEWNGGRPAGGGGGFLYVGQGSDNWNVQYTYAHGFSAVQYAAPNSSMAWIYADGCVQNTSGCSTPPVMSTVNISYNRIGASDGGDCAALMQEYQYIPDNTKGSNYGGSVGGYCGTLGVHTTTSGWSVTNNNWFHVEQAGKCYEAETASPYYAFLHTNWVFQYNDFSQIHRIGFESQCGAVGTMVFDSNSIHDPYYGGYGSWPLSLPQSGGSPGSGGGKTNSTNNVIAINTPVGNVPSTQNNCYQYASGATSCYSGTSTGGYYYPGAVEFWGPGTEGNNLIQGYIGGVGVYGCQTGPGTVSYNLAQIVGATYVTGPEQCSGVTAPTQVGNTFSTINMTSTFPTALVTANPTISVNGNSVTISAPGRTGSTTQGPLGNTSAWYTTNGSTPGATTSTYCGSMCVFSVSNGTTVKALAMWGASNQPGSYASNFGFTPSSVVSATVAGGGTVTLSSIALSGPSGSLIAGGTGEQLSATGTYSDGSTSPVTPTSWATANSSICTVDSNGNVTPVAAGSCSITGTYTGVTSSAFPITITAPTITSLGLNTTPTTGVNSIAVGGTVQMQLIAHYNNGTTAVISATSYAIQASSPSTGVCSVTSPGGLVTGVGAGTCTIQANGVSSGWGITVTAHTLTSIALSAASTSLLPGATVATTSTGTYSDSSTGPVTPATYTSSNTSILTVDVNGNVTAAGCPSGATSCSATVTATIGSVNSNALSFTVTASTPTLISLTLSPNFSYSSQSFAMTLLGSYSDGSSTVTSGATWTSTNPLVASVDTTGLVTPNQVGSTQIGASVGSIVAPPVSIVVPPPSAYGNPTSWPSFCPAFQTLTPGTYTVTISATGAITIVP